MKLSDFLKKASYGSNDIPVRVVDTTGAAVAGGKDLDWYTCHCGLEAERKIKDFVITKDCITIRVH